MKSFTGNSSPVRGWALLLTLLLGAGMMISACGDEEVPAPTTPTPTPTPPAPTPEPTPEPTGPATPENLRVSATTSTSITWTWDAVEGALAYEGQFSTDATFTNVAPPFYIIAPNTSQTVPTLSENTTGHFRVRSGAGTSLTDLQFSDWSDGVSGTTDAASTTPTPATALDAPDNLETSDADRDSIVLTWDAVANAETYEVEQRDEDATSYSPASCDGEGNVVEETTCTASDLDAGTDYDFRVRGVPADDDTEYSEGGVEHDVGNHGWQPADPYARRNGRPEHPLAQRRRPTTTPTSCSSGTGRVTPCTRRPCWRSQARRCGKPRGVANVSVEDPCKDVNDMDSGDEPKYASHWLGDITKPANDHPRNRHGTLRAGEGQFRRLLRLGNQPCRGAQQRDLRMSTRARPSNSRGPTWMSRRSSTTRSTWPRIPSVRKLKTRSARIRRRPLGLCRPPATRAGRSIRSLLISTSTTAACR